MVGLQDQCAARRRRHDEVRFNVVDGSKNLQKAHAVNDTARTGNADDEFVSFSASILVPFKESHGHPVGIAESETIALPMRWSLELEC